MHSNVLIIGAGLSGLLLGYRLKLAGIPFKIIESRNRIGGRIHTLMSANGTPVEMGATWFGDQHIHIKQLLHELSIPYFEQYMEGTSFFQPFSTSPASAIPIPSQPPSYRIAGGTSSLVHSLASVIGNDAIALNEHVKRIDFSEKNVTVYTNDKSFEGSKIILAIPPKLWSNIIDFSPSLPNELKDIATATHTWMEDSIKVAITFNQPFWRQSGQSGTLFSNTGPITELYDHCNYEENKYALCGFVNPSFKRLTLEERKKNILKQLNSVFGNSINSYTDYNEQIWSLEDNTFFENQTPLFPHQNNGNPIFQTSYFNGKLFISSAEVAPIYPGYMEGAVVSSMLLTERIINKTVPNNVYKQ
ncbi:flavin monoamine oxidase family protein [Tenacibaculum crassostreae]|uniref:flavin monoamine oxidase family protein n=1 Tax=Tenacibaculum crassostreae TaxID=502683 RepID=UPI0038932C64